MKVLSRLLTISCNTLIVNSILDEVPSVICYDQKIQMVHACKTNNSWKIPQSDKTVFVSQTAKDSWNVDNGTVIHNMISRSEDKPLVLLSATRVSNEKGQNRMVEFGRLLKEKGIKYVWLLFTDLPIKGMTPEMIQMPPISDISHFIRSADYVVHLSDSEAYSYVILESLVNQTPLIVTPLPMLDEIGFVDTKMGYNVPYDISELSNDVIDKIAHKIPQFTFKYDNDTLVDEWRDILGDSTPTKSYSPNQTATVRVTANYYDMELQKDMSVGEHAQMPLVRAEYLQDEHGFVEIVG